MVVVVVVVVVVDAVVVPGRWWDHGILFLSNTLNQT